MADASAGRRPLIHARERRVQDAAPGNTFPQRRGAARVQRWAGRAAVSGSSRMRRSLHVNDFARLVRFHLACVEGEDLRSLTLRLSQHHRSFASPWAGGEPLLHPGAAEVTFVNPIGLPRRRGGAARGVPLGPDVLPGFVRGGRLDNFGPRSARRPRSRQLISPARGIQARLAPGMKSDGRRRTMNGSAALMLASGQCSRVAVRASCQSGCASSQSGWRTMSTAF